MADTTTLQSTQPKEKKIHPQNAVGGGFEYIDNTVGNLWETVTGVGPGYFVNEGPVREQLKAKPTFPTTGELTGFQNQSTEVRRQQITAELAAAQSQTLNQAPVKIKRETINQLNSLQTSYQGSVDNQGIATEYHKTNADRKEAETLALQIQNERQEKLASAKGKKTPGFAMGENELGKGQENFGHFTRAIG